MPYTYPNELEFIKIAIEYRLRVCVDSSMINPSESDDLRQILSIAVFKELPCDKALAEEIIRCTAINYFRSKLTDKRSAMNMPLSIEDLPPDSSIFEQEDKYEDSLEHILTEKYPELTQYDIELLCLATEYGDNIAAAMSGICKSTFYRHLAAARKKIKDHHMGQNEEKN